MKKYSIKDIARLSGVSVATVSRVINNNGRFSNETKEKVEKVIEETNYLTNFTARSLRTNKSFTIGILVPDISNYIFADIVQKMEEILFKKGYSTIICNTAKNNEKEKAYLRTLESKGVDGIVVISGNDEFGFEYSNPNRNIPYICIDREPKNMSETIFISSNHYKGAFDATNELMNSGCLYPIIVMHKRQSTPSRERLSGFQDALRVNNITYDKEKHLLIADTHQTNFSSIVQKFLETNNEIDGVFAINDAIAVELLSVFKNLKISIPEDLKIIGFDDTPKNNYITPSLSSVRQDTEQIATVSVDNLLEIIKTPKKTGEVILIPISLSLRESSQIV